MARLYPSGSSGWQWQAHPISLAAASDALATPRLGHDLWIVSELVDLVDLFVDVPDHGVRGPGGEQEAVGIGAVRECELPEEGGIRHSRREVQGEFQGVFPVE